MRHLGIWARAVLMLGLIFAALAVLLGWYFVRDIDYRIATQKAVLLGDARLLAAHQDSLVARADAILNGLMLSPELAPAASEETCRAFLIARLRQEREFVQIVTARANGDVLCSAVPRPKPNTVVNRPYYDQTIVAHQMIIADVLMSTTLERPVIIFGKAMRDPDGSVTGLFFLSLDLGWLAQGRTTAGLPPDVRLVVIDGQSVVTARYPDPEGMTGKRLPESLIIRQVLAAPGAGTLEETNLAGERRLIAHVPLTTTTSGGNYHLLLSLPRDAVVGPAQAEAIYSFGALLLVLCGTMATVLFGVNRLLLHPIAKLSQTAIRTPGR